MTKRTVGLDEAAAILNISKEALRKRIKRGTIEAEKDNNGRWKITIDDAGQDSRQDAGEDVSSTLVGAMQKEIDFLRKELERKDHILMALTQKIPQLEAQKQDQERQEQDRLPWWKRLFKKE